MFYGRTHTVYAWTRKGEAVFTLRHICFTVKHMACCGLRVCLTVKLSCLKFWRFWPMRKHRARSPLYEQHKHHTIDVQRNQ